LNRGRYFAVTLAAVTAGLAWSCAPKTVRPAERVSEDLVVLLPDPASRVVGRATVSNPLGSVELASERDSTRVSANRPPAPVTTMSEADVQQIFAAALSALPLAPLHFTLNFLFDSDELTPESRALIPQILASVKDRPAPEVLVVGHTDTIGPATTNVSLGLKRATTVGNLLVGAGLDRSFMEVTSHGEADLLVPTGDEVAQPRNRRVEITVR
jgi:outer membrane protein OmpA-like peptidoglycan-associated protein